MNPAQRRLSIGYIIILFYFMIILNNSEDSLIKVLLLKIIMLITIFNFHMNHREITKNYLLIHLIIIL